MSKAKGETRLLVSALIAAIILSFSGPALATDDGARAYWNARAGTNAFSFQYLRWDIDASGSFQFDPVTFIYPGADTEASVFVLSWARHMTLFNRASSFAVNLVGGNVDVDLDTGALPPQVLPVGVVPGASVSQSSSGYADPNVQLVVNLLGTPPLKSNVDLLNYEPTWTLDAAVMLAVPIGEYDADKLVNLGLNRLWGRVALPIKYHFGVFSPGYMSSFELIPSVWLFAENDDFVGQSLENDPLWQLEAHLTHDFTRSFFGSVDALYRSGFQSEVDGNEVGDELEVGNVGFTLNYQVTDNVTMRTGFSSNVFGDSNLDNSILRLQFVYAWNRDTENSKKLQEGH
jgi:hypothetical protein